MDNSNKLNIINENIFLKDQNILLINEINYFKNHNIDLLYQNNNLNNKNTNLLNEIDNLKYTNTSLLNEIDNLKYKIYILNDKNYLLNNIKKPILTNNKKRKISELSNNKSSIEISNNKKIEIAMDLIDRKPYLLQKNNRQYWHNYDKLKNISQSIWMSKCKFNNNCTKKKFCTFLHNISFNEEHKRSYELKIENL
jgi:hypothetical protein